LIYGKRDLDWRVPRESTASIDLSQNVPYHYHLIKDIQDILVNADIHDYANDYKIYEAVCSEYNLDINRVSVGIGASDLLDRLVRILPVKKYYVVEPSYRMFEIYCQWYGKVYESIEHIENIYDKNAAIYISNPNGNNGKIYDTKNLTDRFKYVIHDEVYTDFSPEVSLLHQNTSNLIKVKSLSKSLSVAGLRVGFAVANEEITETLQYYRQPYVTSKVSELVIPKLLPKQQSYVDDWLDTRHYLESKFDCVKSHSNYVLFKEENKYTKKFGARVVNGLHRMALCDLATLMI